MVPPARRGPGASLALAAAAVLLAASLPAAASEPGPAANWAALASKGPQSVLAEADRLANHHGTQRWRMRMTIRPPGGDAKTLVFRVWQKGQRKRLVRFDEPGDVKGLSMLSASKTVMYVYSPDTDNARRVGTSARRQTLLGSNMNYEDMASVDLSNDYEARFDGPADAGRRWLTLKRKAASEASWDTLRVGISTKTAMAEVIEYYEGGELARVQTRSGFEVLGGVPTYRDIEMKSVDTGLVTELHVLEQEIGLDLPDKMFKKRYLIRGR